MRMGELARAQDQILRGLARSVPRLIPSKLRGSDDLSKALVGGTCTGCAARRTRVCGESARRHSTGSKTLTQAWGKVLGPKPGKSQWHLGFCRRLPRRLAPRPSQASPRRVRPLDAQIPAAPVAGHSSSLLHIAAGGCATDWPACASRCTMRIPWRDRTATKTREVVVARSVLTNLPSSNG
jgi:hypothetical protein